MDGPLLHEWFDALAEILWSVLSANLATIVIFLSLAITCIVLSIVGESGDSKTSIASVTKSILPPILLGAIWVASAFAALHFAFFLVSRLDPQLIQEVLRFKELLWSIDRTEATTVIVVFVFLIVTLLTSGYYMEKFQQSSQIAPKNDAAGKPALPASNQDKYALRQAWTNPEVGRGSSEGISQVADRITVTPSSTVRLETTGASTMTPGIAKGFGIAAMVLAILSVFIPIYGILVSGVAIVLACVAALGGDRVFATATPLISAVNVFFLTPSIDFWESNHPGSKAQLFTVATLCVAAPFVAMALSSVFSSAKAK
jgi:hypothetical protein